MGDILSKLVYQPPDPFRHHHVKEYITLDTRLGETISCTFLNYGFVYTVLFSHGNAEDIGLLTPWFDKYICGPVRVNVFLYDYCGYGLSSGVPSEDNVFADAEAAYVYLTENLGIDPSTIVLYGRSLGTAPTVHIASKFAKHSIRGMVLQSPMLSIYRVAFNFRFTMPGDIFASIDKVPHITCPSFVIHGAVDEVIPFWHGQMIVQMLPNAVTPLFIEDGGHNNLETDFEPLLLSKLFDFIHTLETGESRYNVEFQADDSQYAVVGESTYDPYLDDEKKHIHA